MSVGPIPWDKIRLYALDYCYDEVQRSDLEFMISELDDIYLHYISRDK